MKKTKQIFIKFKNRNIARSMFSKGSLPASPRSPDGERRYMINKKAGLTRRLIDEPYIKEWNYWALINNDYPYDGIFRVSHMLIPKRLATKKDLKVFELNEFNEIVERLSNEYDCYMVNFAAKQSVNNHFHVHFLVYYGNRKDFKL